MTQPLTVEEQWHAFRVQALPFLIKTLQRVPTHEQQKKIEEVARFFFYAGAGAHDKLILSLKTMPHDDIGPYLQKQSVEIVDTVMGLAKKIVEETFDG